MEEDEAADELENMSLDANGDSQPATGKKRKGRKAQAPQQSLEGDRSMEDQAPEASQPEPASTQQENQPYASLGIMAPELSDAR